MESVRTKFFSYGSRSNPVRLESGETLSEVTLAYETYGELNAARDNSILVFHALSGSQHAAGSNPSLPEAGDLWQSECYTGWWDDFIGPGKVIDTNHFHVICCNYLGGCYGTTGPSSLDPATSEPYGSSFPAVSFSDVVDTQVELLTHLGISKLHAVVGASLGGMMALNLSVRYPDKVRLVCLIATSFYSTVLQRVLNLEQVQAIERDPQFLNGDYYHDSGPINGLSLARMIAHKTYVSLEAMKSRASGELIQPSRDSSRYKFQHAVESYMLHHGDKFTLRFDANTYLILLVGWLNYDLLRDSCADSINEMFGRCSNQRFLIFSIDSDVCFYPEEQKNLSEELKLAGVESRLVEVKSQKGHDAFLLEPELFRESIKSFLDGE